MATYTLSFDVCYKGYGEDGKAHQAVKDFLSQKYPSLAKFKVHETGDAGYDLKKCLRDIRFKVNVKDEPIPHGTLVAIDNEPKNHRFGKYKISAKVESVKDFS